MGVQGAGAFRSLAMRAVGNHVVFVHGRFELTF